MTAKSQFVRSYKSTIFLLGACALWPIFPASAQQPAPGALPQRPRPKIPLVFDRTAVQGLLDTIEIDNNAMALKLGYFSRRGKPELPIPDGYELLKAALAKEEAGSKRWFVLQELRGWAAFRMADIPKDEGYLAYNALFDAARDAKKARAVNILNTAIGGYVGSVNAELGAMNLQGDEKTRETLLKAWAAYSVLLETTKTSGRALAWTKAIKESGSKDEFKTVIKSALDNRATPKSYALLTLAAELLAAEEPQRAAAFLKEAKPLLTTDDKHEVTRFYNSLVDALIWSSLPKAAAKGVKAKPEDKTKLDEAIAMQRELIKLTGRGNEKLARILVRKNDKKSLNEVLDSLAAPGADEREINEAAGALIKLWQKDKVKNEYAATRAETLLSTYLAAQQPRTVEQELLARWRLGFLYMGQKKTKEAKAVLKTDHLIFQQPLSSAAQDYLSRITQMTGQLGLQVKIPVDEP